MEHTFEEKAYIANNRPFMKLVGLKAEPKVIESRNLTDCDLYDESIAGKINPEIHGYHAIALTLQFKNLGNDELPVSVGFHKFVQFCGCEDWDTDFIFETPACVMPLKKSEDNTYEQTYFFICQPCKEEDEADFEKFSKSFTDQRIMVIFNMVCENDRVRECFECVGKAVFDGQMFDTEEFSKDRRSYSIIQQ